MGRKKKVKELLLFSDEELEMMVDSLPEEATGSTSSDTDDSKLSNATIIRNISYDQTEILHNIGQLYNGGSDQFDCDMTASSLGFYGNVHGGKYNIPEPQILMDVFPQRDDIIQIEKWGALPLENGAVHSIVIDLPFVISPQNAPSVAEKKDGSNLIFKRFAGYYPVDNLYLSYYHWLSEAYRVLDDGGICIFKCQSCISGGIRHNIEEFSFMAGQRLGFRMEDKFTLLAKARLISPNKYKNGQQHSRSYTSQFLVFIKDTGKRKSKDFFFENMLDRCKKEEEEKYINVVEK